MSPHRRPKLENPGTVGVILTTCNWAWALERTLEALCRQAAPVAEVWVAEDGEDPATLEVARRYRARLPLRHLRQPYEGFRKCRLLNRAIAASSAAYLVILDGDCMPRADYVAGHLRLRRPGAFAFGGIVSLDAVRTRQVTLDWIRSGDMDRADALLTLDASAPLPPRSHRLRPPPLGLRYAWPFVRRRGNFGGGCSSAWRADLLAANGFDERMGWGHEDTELGVRLNHAGIAAITGTRGPIALHLHHERPYKDEAVIARNWDLLQETRRSGRSRTEHGIEQLPAGALATVE